MAADKTEKSRGDVKFTFLPLGDRRCATLNAKNVDELLLKWSMKGRITIQYYSYDALFQSYHKEDFALDFLQSRIVLSTLKVLSDSNRWCPVGLQAHKVEITAVPCSITSMAFFDRLYKEGIVRESGSIVKCLDEYYEGFQIADELRKMLLLEESDFYDVYNEDERQEFLFLIFKHLCLGGAICQYEDDIKPYLETAKLLYKDLVSVQKDGSTQQLNVASLVYKLKAWDETGHQYYPSDHDHDQTFSYIIIDPLKRTLAVLYHRYGGGVFS